MTLKATLGAILDPGRGRVFIPEERARLEQTIAQGYANRLSVKPSSKRP